MRALCLAAGVAGFFAAPGLADDVQTILYRCERGVGIRATYINTAGTSHAVLFAEGRQAALTVQPTASVARHAAPQGTSGHVWWTKGPQGIACVVRRGKAGRGRALHGLRRGRALRRDPLHHPHPQPLASRILSAASLSKVTPLLARSWSSSPESVISVMISQPPTNSALT